MKELNLQNFIEESGLLKEVEKITTIKVNGLPNKEDIMKEFKGAFLDYFSDIDGKILEKYSEVLESYDILVNPKKSVINTTLYVIITKRCMKTICFSDKVLVLNGIITLVNVKEAYAKNNSIVKFEGNSDCYIKALDKSIVTISGKATGYFYDESRGIAKGNSYAYFENSGNYGENIVTDSAKATACGDRKTLCLEKSFCKFKKDGYRGTLYDESTAIAEDGAIISCFDKAKATGKDISTIYAYKNSSIELKDFSRCFLNENAKVEAEDTTVVYVRNSIITRNEETPTAIMKGDSVIFIEEGINKEKIVLKGESTSIVYKI